MNQWTRDDALVIANRERETYGISAYVYRGWKAHKDSARKRGIDFRFTLFEWHCWWNAELATLGPDARRGRRRGEYVMARRGDAGAYEHANVYVATPGQNARDIPEDIRAMMIPRIASGRMSAGKPRGYHLKVRGDGHPRSKAVVTPRGRYGSIALAAEAHGISRAGGCYRVERGEWRLA